MKRLIKVLIFSLHILLFPVFSRADIVSNLSLPSELGTVKETYSAQGGPGKTIIQIQDAHCNYEAQKKLSAIIEHIIKRHGVKLVLVEGGSGDIGLSFLRGYSDKRTREEVAEKYLKSGQISGEEYLDIVSDYELSLYGIEDEDLYNSNLEAFLSTDTVRQRGLEELRAIAVTVKKLKERIYGPALKEFESRTAQFEAKKLGLAEYGAYLREKARATGAKAEFEHLSSFLDSLKLEKRLDFKLAEKERNECIKQLGTLLDEASVKQLVARTREFTAGAITPLDFYVYLRDLAASRVNLPVSFPNLDSYINYMVISKSVKAENLVREISVLESKIRSGLCSNEDERALSDIDSRQELTVKFLRLELSPEEYSAFSREKEKQSTSSWMEFLSRACLRYGLTAPVASEVIDANFDHLESFYKLGMARERSFFKNMTRKMSLSGEPAAVLITGGFHTEGINRMLRDSGYSYAVVTPAISQNSDPEVYFAVLRSEQAGFSDDTAEDSD